MLQTPLEIASCFDAAMVVATGIEPHHQPHFRRWLSSNSRRK
ncbi:MAG: hypothetical protein N838_20300 [Thiohalocapsa sp. PB-PSB1]|nr:MAG: hypothetical protein N838_20300 [Thiohalocapsa sp. PB-PSB1]